MNYIELEVWLEARKLTSLVYDTTKTFPKEELYSFNAQKYNFEKPIFLENEFSINRTIDGSKIEKLGFNYQYFDAFNF